MKILYVFLGIIGFFVVALIPWFSLCYISETFIVKLDQAGILLGYFLSCLSVVIGVYAWIRRKDIKKWFSRSKFQNVGEPFDVPEKNVEAIIIPVSPHKEQPEWILRWLKPKHVSFLYSAKSQATAEELANEFSRPPFNIEFYPNAKDIELGKYMIENVDKPELSKIQVQMFIARLIDMGIAANKIFIDTTAGTVPMSIGAFQMAEEMGISSIYVVGTQDRFIKNPKKRAHGNPVFISNRIDKM